MNKGKTAGMLALLALSLTACGSGNNTAQTPPQETQTQIQTEASIEVSGSETDSSILIAYFSRVGNTEFGEGVDASSSASIQLDGSEIAGNTELVAGMIQENAGGDMFLIETAGKYPADYDEVLDVAQAEGNEAARPELVSHVEHMDDYNVIFLGYPNWWGDCPMAVYSFLEEYDFSGKTVIPFCTSGGSGLSGTVSTIRGMLPDSTVLDGFDTGDSSIANAQASVAEWASGLGITE